MMTAREMFKELGYECRYFKQWIYYTKIDYFGRMGQEIKFDLRKKTYCCINGMAIRCANDKENEAIQKQKEELGWIEKETK